jgi:peptidoglycan hydrolase-like protein with peptidoglycan-binding domain
MKTFYKAALLGVLGAALFIGSLASAQTLNTSATVTSSNPVALCTQLTHGLGFGSRDYYTGGDVTALQNYLQARGYFNYKATGYFGSITARAVATWQRDNGIAAIGIVGPLTRAALAAASCNGGVVPPPSNTAPTIYSITPTSGPTGTTVSITGFGFTSDNTILFGSGAIVHVPITSSIAISCTNDPNCHGGINQTITFTVPTSLNPLCYYSTPQCMIASRMTDPGTYNVSVQTTGGTSNTVSFTVTSPTTTVAPVIYSITPTTGPVGTTVNIRGFGFTNDNTVHFGSGALYHVPITSSIAIACTTDPSCHGGINQTLSITIPDYLGPYCPPNAMCALWVRQITPGSYDLFVQNDSGSSGTTTYTVTL